MRSILRVRLCFSSLFFFQHLCTPLSVVGLRPEVEADDKIVEVSLPATSPLAVAAEHKSDSNASHQLWRYMFSDWDVPVKGLRNAGTEALIQEGSARGWKARIRECSDSTPFVGIKEASVAARAAGLLTESLGDYIVAQVEERIASQCLPIDQGWEGLCSITSIEYVLCITDPNRFAETVADLFCSGTASGRKRGFSMDIAASHRELHCKTSARAEESSDEHGDELFHMQDPTAGKIRAVDWIFAASLAATWNSRTHGFSPCGNHKGQRQKIDQYEAIGEVIFPHGHLETRLEEDRYMKKADWNQILSVVRSGGQALLRTDPRLGDEKPSGAPGGHAVVLTEVLSADDTTEGCAKRILEDVPACVVWTWASYYVWESCESLRRTVGGIVLIQPRAGFESAGPAVFHKGRDLRLQVEYNLRLYWKMRRTGNWQLQAGRKSFPDRAVLIHNAEHPSHFVPSILVGDRKRQGFPHEDYRACLTMQAPAEILPGTPVAVAAESSHAGVAAGSIGVVVGRSARGVSVVAFHDRVADLDHLRPLFAPFTRRALVRWNGVDADVPAGTVGSVISFAPTAQAASGQQQVQVKFPRGSWWFPANALTLLFHIGDPVDFIHATELVPSGSVGTVVGAVQGKYIVARFEKGTWAFNPADLRVHNR